jgi:hypothetical protein
LYSSVELHHPAPIKRVSTLSLFDERVVDQKVPNAAGFDDRIPATQEANASDCGTGPEPMVHFPDEWIVQNESNLEDLSILGDPATPQVPPSSVRGQVTDFNKFPPAVSAISGHLDSSLNAHDPYLRTQNLPLPKDTTFPRLLEEQLFQPGLPCSDSPHNPSASCTPGRMYDPSELQQQFPTNSWDPVSDVLARKDHSFISPLLGMTGPNHYLQIIKNVQPPSPVAPPFGNDAHQTNVWSQHLSTMACPFSPFSSPAPSSEHLQSYVIADAFNRKLMKHVSDNYTAPLPALNFVDALLRRRRDNKYVSKSRSRFYPQLHKPELTGYSGRNKGAFPPNTLGPDNFAMSNGGCSAEARAADLYAREPFTPSLSNCDSTNKSEPQETSGSREAADIIQYHQAAPLDHSLDAEASHGGQPSFTDAAHSALRTLRDRFSRRIFADPPFTPEGPSSRTIRTHRREAAELRSWPSQNDNPSGYASFGNLNLGPPLKNVASFPRTLPPEPSPLGNLNVSSYVKTMANFPRTQPPQLGEQVGRNSGRTENVLPHTPGRSARPHTSNEIRTPTVASHAIPNTPQRIIGDERVRRRGSNSHPASPEAYDKFMRGPEDLAFSEVMAEDNEDWTELGLNGDDVAADGEDIRTDSTENRNWRNDGDGSSAASSVLAENVDIREWSESGGTSRGSSHDSIESWSNTDVLSFLKGEPQS